MPVNIVYMPDGKSLSVKLGDLNLYLPELVIHGDDKLIVEHKLMRGLERAEAFADRYNSAFRLLALSASPMIVTLFVRGTAALGINGSIAVKPRENFNSKLEPQEQSPVWASIDIAFWLRSAECYAWYNDLNKDPELCSTKHQRPLVDLEQPLWRRLAD